MGFKTSYGLHILIFPQNVDSTNSLFPILKPYNLSFCNLLNNPIIVDKRFFCSLLQKLPWLLKTHHQKLINRQNLLAKNRWCSQRFEEEKESLELASIVLEASF